jgi:hypothetical protein
MTCIFIFIFGRFYGKTNGHTGISLSYGKDITHDTLVYSRRHISSIFIFIYICMTTHKWDIE